MVELVGFFAVGNAESGRGLEMPGQPVGSCCGKGVSGTGFQVGGSASGKLQWEGGQQMGGSGIAGRARGKGEWEGGQRKGSSDRWQS